MQKRKRLRPARVYQPFRSLLKYPATPRESGLGWMARRERPAYPQRPVSSEQRSQTTQSALALWVAPIFRPSGVARRLQTQRVSALLAPWRDEKSAATRHGWYFNRLLSACDRRVVFGAMVRLDRH